MELSLLNMISHSSPLALGVLIILLLCSLIVWAVLIGKLIELLKKRKVNLAFLDIFEKEIDLDELRNKLETYPESALKHMFEMGEEETYQFFGQNRLTGFRARAELLEMLERLFESCIVHEERQMGSGQTLLATVSVIAPFIGLFGTVVGIIDAFQSIAHLKSVELTVIAPGISEALIATAAGLFAAIPAAMGFNIFRAMIRENTEHMEYFALELLRRLQLQLMALDEKET